MAAAAEQVAASGLDDDELAAVFSGNAARLLGL
jgi:predicted TIM-barrel fold metal-dependent hydrolase